MDMIKAQQDKIKAQPLCTPAEPVAPPKPPTDDKAQAAVAAQLKDIRGELNMVQDTLGKMTTQMKQNNSNTKHAIKMMIKDAIEKMRQEKKEEKKPEAVSTGCCPDQRPTEVACNGCPQPAPAADAVQQAPAPAAVAAPAPAPAAPTMPSSIVIQVPKAGKDPEPAPTPPPAPVPAPAPAPPKEPEKPVEPAKPGIDEATVRQIATETATKANEAILKRLDDERAREREQRAMAEMER